MTNEFLKEALYFESLDHERVRCTLCPHHCVILEGHSGFCKVRTNLRGKLFATGYGYVSGMSLDPIEKKPLYHYFPGKSIFSVGFYGCNFSCVFCQNAHISQYISKGEKVTKETLITIAEAAENNIGLAFTYNEPLIHYEFVLETFKAIKRKGSNLKTILVTNGYIDELPLKALLEVTDAMNIDLKSDTDDFYQKLCGGSRDPVLRTIRLAKEQGVHVEVTTLLVTDHSDSVDTVSQIAKWIAEIDDEIPLHLSRYFPRYKMDLPETAIDRMTAAYHVAKKYLKYVYLGNV